MLKKQADKGRKNLVRYNDFIRIPQVLVIQDGNNLGVMATKDAIALARENGLDLVEVAPHSRPPVCQIMEYGKYMFDKSKKEKQKSTQQREKEISFRYVTDAHDIETKVNQAKKFLDKGFKVKLVVRFKKREKVHKELGFETLKQVIDMLRDYAFVEIEPKFEGANVMAKLDIKKAKP
jgi:translation initiation factor IF-3